MNKRFKRFLAMLMVFAMMLQYSISIDSIVAFAEDAPSATVQEDVQNETPEAASEQPDEPDVTPAEEPQEATKDEALVTEEPDQDKEAASEASEDASEEVKTDEAAPEEPEKDKTEEPSVKYPLQNFSGEAGKVVVFVTAPEGALPEGSSMKVTSVSQKSVIDAVQNAVDGDVTKVRAVDITFFDKDGKDIEPQKEVSVVLRASGMNEAAGKEVVHIDDKGKATVVDGASVSNSGIAKFSSDQFSIYAVADVADDHRITVKFMNGDEEVESVQVKKKDADSLDTLIYDPEIGSETGANSVFKGWGSSEDSTEGVDIDAVREQVKAHLNEGVSVDDNSIMTFYAVFGKSFILEYRDTDDNNNAVLKTEVVESDADSVGTTVDLQYSVSSQDQGFIGWKDSNGTLYKNGSEISLSEPLTILTPDIENGYWLVFDENDGGSGTGRASFTSPEFVQGGNNPTRPEDPTRPGYAFDDWYTAAEGGSVFEFNNPLSGPTEVFAHWEPQNVEYKIIVWYQNIDDDKSTVINNPNDKNGKTYDYSGTMETISAASGTTIDDSVVRKYEEKEVAGFHYAGFDITNGAGANKKQVSGLSDTVVNVYFNRNLMTVDLGHNEEETYLKDTYTYAKNEEIDSWTIDIYGKVNKKYYKLTREQTSGFFGNYYKYYYTVGGEKKEYISTTYYKLV